MRKRIAFVFTAVIFLASCQRNDTKIKEDLEMKRTVSAIGELYQDSRNEDYPSYFIHPEYEKCYYVNISEAYDMETDDFRLLNPSKADDMPVEGSIFHVYGKEKYIGEAKLVKLEKAPYLEEDEVYYQWLYNEYNSFALSFTDASIDLEDGCYIILENNDKALSRPVTISDDAHRWTVDLLGTNKNNIIEFSTDGYWVTATIDREEGEESEYILGLYNGDSEDAISYVDGIPETEGYLAVYDLDKDGKMELIKYSVYEGGEDYSIFRYKDDEWKMTFLWNSEEDFRFKDEEGREYYFDGPNKKYYDEISEKHMSALNKATWTVARTEDHVDEKSMKIKNSIVQCSNREAHQIFAELKDGHRAGIDGLGVARKTDFFERLHSIFDFDQSSYTNDYSDIVKGLKDLSWLGVQDVNLFIWDYDKMLMGMPGEKFRLIGMLEEEILPHWAGKEGHSFMLYLASEDIKHNQKEARKSMPTAIAEKEKVNPRPISLTREEVEESDPLSPKSESIKVQHIRHSEKASIETNARMNRDILLVELGRKELRSKRDFMYAMQDAFRFPKDWNGMEESYIQAMRDLSWLEEKTGFIVLINNIQATVSNQMKDFVIDSFENKVFSYLNQEKPFDVYWVEK